jgi:YegS/Rv2252/BmrU family lipid kinase
VSDVRASGTLTFVIINPVSGPARRGTADQRVRLATDALDAVGLRAEILLTESEGHASELARHAVGAGAELVIAWGGDGTINEVGRAVAFSDTALGIVPAGSGNGLARELGIPFSPRKALAHALTKPARQIDAAEIEGRLFFNVAGIGLDAHVAERVSRKHHAHGGLRRYIIASSRELVSYAPVEYTIRTDKDTFRQTALVVVVANSRQYGYGASIAPTARLADGELDLVIIEDRGLAGNLLRMPFLMTGGLHRRPGVTIRRVKEVTVTAARPMGFHVDGEALAGGTELTARVRPGALRVRA